MFADRNTPDLNPPPKPAGTFCRRCPDGSDLRSGNRSGRAPGLAARLLGLTGLLLLILTALTGTRAWPEPRTLTVGGDLHFPPYEFLDDEGQPAGFNIELMQAVAQVMGYQVNFKLGPWSQMIDDLEAGRIDVLPMYNSAEYNQFIEFTDPYALLYYQAFVRRNTLTLRGLADLRDREVIVEQDSFLHDYLSRHDYGVRLITAANEPEALRLLAAGNHDYALVNHASGLLAVQRYQLTNLITTGPPLLPGGYALAVNKSQGELLAQLNQGLAIVKATGRFDELQQRWLGTLSAGSPPAEAMTRYAAWALIILGLLTIGALTWSGLLQRQVAQRTRELSRELAERHEVEQALRQNEERLQDITEAASDWIWEMDQNFRFTHLSDRFYELTGVAPDLVLGHPRWELAVDDDPLKWRQHRQTLEQHAPFRDFIYQMNIPDRQGCRHYLRISGKPVHDAQGDFIGYRGTGADITAQVTAEMALRQSEARLRKIIDLVPHMIFAKDRTGKLLLANQAVAEAYGTTVEELVGQPHRVVHPVAGEVQRMLADDLEVIDRGQSKFIAEEIFTDHTGAQRILQTTKIPYSEPGSTERALLGIAVDITDRIRAENELMRVRLYLKSIIDSMPSVLVGVDPKGHITEFNTPAEQISDISREAAQGRFFGEVLPQLKDQMPQVQRAIRQGRHIKTQRMTTTFHGEPHHIDVMVYPLIVNTPIGAVIRVDDVTRQVRMENMMVQTEKMLSIGGLAAGMAHEINNPLGIILQNSQNIQRRLSPDLASNQQAAATLGLDLEQINRYLESRRILQFLRDIQEAGARAASIITDMLAYSRRSDLQFIPTDLSEILDRVVRLAASDYDLKKRYAFKNIQIERDYDASLGPVPCDRTEIEQVILNLVKNAAQAMAEAATPAPTITLRTRREANYARIEVLDNGPGMDADVCKRVFDPFFTTKAVGQGTGLGLSVSYFIVTEQHKGTLAVKSKPGQGACFTIRLPRQR